jgi:4-hydroxybenzoate polyprenyltransferase
MSGSSFRQYVRVARHFAAFRALEVSALQASPFLGAVLGGTSGSWPDLGRVVLLLVGSLALTGHVFVFNDWAGRLSDANDPRRALRVFGRRGISSKQVASLAIALLLFAIFAFALIGLQTVLLGLAVASLSLVYSYFFGKGTPVIASVIHLLGGMCHFLLGYTIVHPVDTRGVAIGIFFGLVFAGGHLNQEVRDREGDLRNEIRTNAVAFGCRPTFLASLLVFTASYIVLGVLAVLALLPGTLLWCLLLWLPHLIWSIQALRQGPGFEVAHWMQRRYRLLFAVLGFAIIFTTPAVNELAHRASPVVRPPLIRTSFPAAPNEAATLLR